MCLVVLFPFAGFAETSLLQLSSKCTPLRVCGLLLNVRSEVELVVELIRLCSGI